MEKLSNVGHRFNLQPEKLYRLYYEFCRGLRGHSDIVNGQLAFASQKCGFP